MSVSVEIRDIKTKGMNGVWRHAADNLVLNDGSRLFIVGPSDSGKTALALLVAGIEDLPHATGYVHFAGHNIAAMAPREKWSRIAFVPTDPSLLFSGLRTTLDGEIALSTGILGRKISKSDLRRTAKINALGIYSLLDRDPFTLSGGEQVRAALALCFAKKPELLILDDIFAGLDPESVRDVRLVIRDFLQTGGTVIETHSSLPPDADREDNCLFLLAHEPIYGPYQKIWRQVGKLFPVALPRLGRIALRLERDLDLSFDQVPLAPGEVAAKLQPVPRRWLRKNPANSVASAGPEPVLCIKDLISRYPEGDFVLGPISLSIPPGEIAALIGPNGAGKTTLLRSLALLHEPQSGSIEIRSREGELRTPPNRKQKHTWARTVMYGFQNPDDQMYSPTVERELVESARLCGVHDRIVFVKSIASMLGLDAVLGCTPADLPRSLRRMLSIGACMAARPLLLLLDEPTAGLDGCQKERLAGALSAFAADGRSVIIVSHDLEFVADTCSTIVSLEQGSITRVTSWPEGKEDFWEVSSVPTVPAVGRALSPPEDLRTDNDLFALFARTVAR